MMTATTTTMRQRFSETAISLLDTNRRIVVLTADIGAGAFAEARRRHPHRVINVGIREQLLIGAAAGFALEGFRPIVHSYAPFLVERPYEQVKLDLSHQGVGAILVSTGASFDAAAEGRTHQAPADVAIINALPDWTIHAPGHPDELEEILRRSARDTGNVYIRMSSQSNARPLPTAGIEVVRATNPSRPTVLAFGPALDAVLEATSGLDVGIVYSSSIRPFNEAELRNAVPGPDLIVVEPFLQGTTAGLVSAALSDRPMRYTHLGVGDREVRRYGAPLEHLRAHGLDPTSLRARIHRITGA